MKFSFIPFAIKVVLSSIVSEARESPNPVGPKDIAERSNRKILWNERRIDGYRGVGSLSWNQQCKERVMSRRHDWRTGKFALPYERSAIVSGVLIVTFLLFLGAFAEPQTGRIRNQVAAYLAIFGLPLAISVAFYIEYRFRNRRMPSLKRHSPKSRLSAKC
jgi:hypothetical protein